MTRLCRLLTGIKVCGRISRLARKKTRPLPGDLNLPPGGADSHTHLDMGGLGSSLKQVLDRASECGVTTLAHVFLGPQAYHQGKNIFDEHDQVLFILGIHPHEAGSLTSDVLNQIIEAAENSSKIKALGEIGLDFFYNHSTPDDQTDAFRKQLEAARNLDLPVVIHSRDAYRETISILTDMGFRDRPLLWHCFGHGPQEAREIMSFGWHISIPGSVTYKKSSLLRDAVKVIDPNRLCIETDCPFLAPEPYRGKENEPALLGFTLMKIAEIKDMNPGWLWVKCGDNCREFFNIR